MIVRGWQARLYPTREQAARLNQWAGSLRFLWNRLLDREKAEYAATGRFVWKKQLQPMAVAMKREPGLEWLADLPAHAVLDCVARMDGALRRMVKERKLGRKCGFPKAKKKFVRESGIYCVGQASGISAREADLPKLGRVRLRGGDAPEGRLLSARVWRDGNRWMPAKSQSDLRGSAQFECARPAAWPATGVMLAADLGTAALVTTFDGSEFEDVAAPKPLRKAQKLRRENRKLARRKKGSARRRCQARRVGVVHRKVRDRRRDVLHQTSHRLAASAKRSVPQGETPQGVSRADVLKFETLNVAGMARNHCLALSVADAGMARLVTFCGYKDWRGRRVVQIDPWFPGSQLCSGCGERHPEMKDLGRRTLRCDCGTVMGRDRNAAVNPYWYGQEPRNRVPLGATRVETGE